MSPNRSMLAYLGLLWIFVETTRPYLLRNNSPYTRADVMDP